MIDKSLVVPSQEDFRSQIVENPVVPVRLRLLADDITPVGIYEQLCAGRPGTFLFESAEKGVWSRWSFIGVNTAATLIGNRDEAHWQQTPPAAIPTEGRPLEVLGKTLDILRTTPDEELPGFTSGLVGYLGYDLVRQLENIPDENPDQLGLPDMAMMLAADVAVLDHHNGELWLVANTYNVAPENAATAWAGAVDRLSKMVAALSQPRRSLLASRTSAVAPQIRRQRPQAEFEALVNRAKEYIRAGDIFQVVPSQRFEIDTAADALAIYRELRLTNPSPYLYLLQFEEQGRPFAIIGSSPEALVTVHDRKVTTRPIAGTRPRGVDVETDQKLAQELLADEKERAEHLMLVDLGRNDLGRVCEPGTVQVTEFMQVHRYSHVMHLEASVTGQLRDEVSALDATMACFPAGTLSGAPKVRAMRIIDELETSRRGPYGGVVGYFNVNGDSDAAIAIRTAVLVDGVAHVQAGAGVVADSVPENEDLESRNKAAAVLGAVARAGRTHVLSAKES